MGNEACYGAICETERGALRIFVAGGLPIKEIADRLGYAEPSTFHRAFKRWTGRTPDEHRRG